MYFVYIARLLDPSRPLQITQATGNSSKNIYFELACHLMDNIFQMCTRSQLTTHFHSPRQPGERNLQVMQAKVDHAVNYKQYSEIKQLQPALADFLLRWNEF